jgi:Zn finger protein HypA/HybF involved in hydrogenase expression
MKNKKITLDSYHKYVVEKFHDKDNLKNQKIKKLKKIQKELEKINKKKDYEISNEEIKKKYDIKLKINTINKEIKKIDNNENEYHYYLNTMELLEKYYSPQDQISSKNIIKSKSEMTIIEYINNSNNNNVSMKNFIKGEKKLSRKKIFFEYLNTIDKSNKKMNINYVSNYTFCDKCNTEKSLIISESLYVCETCGECNITIIENEKKSYKDNIIENYNFSYKRYNHFIEWLNQFQALESTTIPINVYNKIKNEIKKQKLDNQKLDNNNMRSILKKINENKYYEHINHIINKLNKIPPPKFSKNLEEKLKLMFKKCQEPFNNVCPPERKNFLSYSYVIRKFLEILNEKKYINSFPLLKSREKLYEQDIIWKNMCHILNWPFFQSI